MLQDGADGGECMKFFHRLHEVVAYSYAFNSLNFAKSSFHGSDTEKYEINAHQYHPIPPYFVSGLMVSSLST